MLKVHGYDDDEGFTPLATSKPEQRHGGDGMPLPLRWLLPHIRIRPCAQEGIGCQRGGVWGACHLVVVFGLVRRRVFDLFRETEQGLEVVGG